MTYGKGQAIKERPTKIASISFGGKTLENGQGPILEKVLAGGIGLRE